MKPIRHLTEDQLIQATVDPADLPDAARQHLEACPECRLEKERFERQLERLGELAKAYTPEPTGMIRVPLQETSPRSVPGRWWWSQAVVVGMAAAAVLVAVLWWRQPVEEPPRFELAQLTQEMQEDALLMAEVEELVDNPMPDSFLDFSGESAEPLTDEFMDFMVSPYDG